MMCSACRLKSRCLADQIANGHVGRFAYPFARPECECETSDDDRAEGGASRTRRTYGQRPQVVMAVLAGAGRPLTTPEVLRAAGVTGDEARHLAGTLRDLANAGRVQCLGQQRTSAGRVTNVWQLAAQIATADAST